MPKKLNIMSWRQAVLLDAKSPIKFGKPTKRKCLCIGRNYYWKDTPTSTWDCYPELAEYIYGLTGVNPRDTGVSCLINVYTEKNHNIGFHIDKSDDLLDDLHPRGNIYSGSIMIPDPNKVVYVGEEPKLGEMVFESDNFFRRTDIVHGGGNDDTPGLVAWDGIVHKAHNIKHKAKTLHPRINITVRLHKDYDRAKQDFTPYCTFIAPGHSGRIKYID